MKSIFSLEAIAEVVPEAPIAPIEIAEDSLLYADSKGEEFELEEAAHEIAQGTGTLKALDGVTAALEAAVGGISSHTGAALMIAVESLCSIKGMTERPQLPVFEEYSTLKMKQDVALEAIAELKAFGQKVLQYIIDVIDKAIAWFKKAFNKQKAKAKDVVKREEAVGQALRLSYTKKEEPVKTNGFTSQALVMALHQNGTVPNGYGLVQAAQAHYKQMKQFDYAFELTSSNVLNHLSQALKAMHKTGDEFKQHINECQSEICSSNIRHKANNQPDDLTPGFTLFEETLTFGDRSFYRSGVTGPAAADPRDMKAMVAAKYRANTDPDLSVTLTPLTLDEIEAISPLISERAKTISRLIEKRDSAETKLSAIRTEILRAQRTKAYDDRAVRRANVLYHVLGMYLSLRSATDVSIMNYDQRVSDSLLTYVEKSLA